MADTEWGEFLRRAAVLTPDPERCAISGAWLGPVGPSGVEAQMDFDAAFLDESPTLTIRECDMERRIAALEAENAALRAHLAALTGAAPAPTDLPDPPRRPDGTLAPEPKPWSPPRETGDRRIIGG